MSSSALKVAVAQLDGTLGDVEKNLGRHLEFIERAREARADLLVFPELSLTGYRLGRDTASAARSRRDPLFDDIARAAAGMTVVVGFVEEGAGAQFYNAAGVVREGGLAFVHRKVNVPTYGDLDEGKLFAQGRQVDVFPVGGPWTGGVLICADLWNPALVHIAVSGGATLLIVPASSAAGAVDREFSSSEAWDLAVRFYAMIYGVPIVMANRVGVENGLRFWGGSRIVDPFGAVIVQADEAGEQLLSAELHYDLLRRARFRLPTLRESNLDLVHREIARLVARTGSAPDAAR